MNIKCGDWVFTVNDLGVVTTVFKDGSVIIDNNVNEYKVKAKDIKEVIGE